MKKIYIITIFLISINAKINSQDKNIEAITYYTNAEDYFNKNTVVDYDNCLKELRKAEKILETTNSKILYLKIKALNEFRILTDYYDTEIDSSLASFFKLTDAKEYPLEKYSEIVKISDQYNKDKMNDSTVIEMSHKIPPEVIIRNYIRAIGGAEQLQQIKSIFSTFESKIVAGEDEYQITGMEKQMFPNKYFIEQNSKIKKNPFANKYVFDGNTAYLIYNGFNQKLNFDIINGYTNGDVQAMVTYSLATSDKINHNKIQHVFFPQILYLTGSYRLKLHGIKNIEGNDYYIIQIISPTDDIDIEFYDVKTNLLVMKEFRLDGGLLQIKYTNYNKIGNVLLPYNHDILTKVFDSHTTIKTIKLNEVVSEEDFK